MNDPDVNNVSPASPMDANVGNQGRKGKKRRKSKSMSSESSSSSSSSSTSSLNSSENKKRKRNKHRKKRSRHNTLVRNQKEAHSSIAHHKYKNMEVKILPALQDNYMYLIIDKITKQAAIVDPVEPNTVLKAVEEQGVDLTTVLTTHHHWDHAGGNKDLLKFKPNLTVYGGDDRIEAITKKVGHNDKFNIGNLKVQCLFTPCHTSGHICYFVTSLAEVDNDIAVFTGDTLFLGGCGRFFEGSAAQMYQALISILSNLPDHTKVFCGHEYSLQNLKFAAYVEPENEDVQKKIQWTAERRGEGQPTVPSTIAEEKLYNPFMRVTMPTVQKHAGKTDPIETMKVIRLEKDSFKG